MCVASIATINTFTTTAVASLKQGIYKSDPRPSLALEIDGIEIPFLYDSGAQTGTISKETFDRYFANRRYARKPGPRILGAGNNNLGLSDCYTMPVRCRGQSYLVDFCVANDMDINVLGVPQLQLLDLNYDAVAREIFSVDNDSSLVSLLGPLTIPPHETRVVTGRFHGNPQSFMTPIVTVASADYPWLLGGPAITEIDQNGRCSLVLTNSGPQDLHLGKGDLLGQIEYLPLGSQLTQVEGQELNRFLHSLSNPSDKGKSMSNDEIRQRIHLDVPPEEKERYLQ